MLGRLGWLEILVIVLLLVILFGHSKIPNMMKNLANGITTFKKEMKKGDGKDTKKESADTAPKKQTKARTKKAAKK
ncbi:MAG: twin-arginine translocase TatA/TatE family subunit [Alphaproteobacteria bacterium]|nr:twin-arginine translocase TatA/TatE family subunit [Alphaproteobacteria bacterium]MBR4806460.1 twin-arginine translocase TatA/TatE family subunit [Alphaproteobacteria bacterium]